MVTVDGTMYAGSVSARNSAELDRRRRGVARPGDDVTDEAHVARHILARDHDRGGDAGVPGEHRLDLAELDPEAAHLDLVVDAPEVLELAVVAPVADEVAGAVDARPGEGSNGSATNRSAVRSGRPPVAAREALAADPQLARDADRHRLQLGVQDVERRVGDRPPDRERLALLSTRAHVDQIVVSVGPYMFHSSRPSPTS